MMESCRKKHGLWLVYQLVVVVVCLWGCDKFAVECATTAESKEQNVIVFPYDVSSSKDERQLFFKIRYDNNEVLQFNLRTSKGGFQTNDNCIMDGVVYSNGFYPVRLATCDGVSGTIFKNASTVLFLKPRLEVGPTVSLDMLSQQAHIMTRYRSNDEIPELFEELYPHEMIPEKKQPKRRDITKIRYAVLSLINRANSVVYMYYMQPQTSQRQYFTDLRKNEKNLLRSYVGTTWLAYDENQQPLLLNDRYNFLVFSKHTEENQDVVITSKKNYSTAERLKSLPDIKPKYLEVLVVGDAAFVKKQGSKEKAKRYIEAIMKMVNLLFRHESLNASFHVVTNKIILLENDDTVKINERNPKDSLTSACKFMYDEKKKQKLNFDFGIFLTRRKFGFSGFTPLFKMCVAYKSCTLIFDSGIKSAFVVAHEIGHGVGISHDGEHNECINDTGKGSIMAPTIYSQFGNYHWSNCSKVQIRENLDYFPCLKNKPKNFKVNLTDLPGATFDIEDQCQRYWGKGYTSCFGVRTPQQHCAYTFCRIPNTKVSRCAYHTEPPVDGTKCDKDKWCVNRKCVPIGRLIPVGVDGSWSNWGEWTSCSARCSQGIRFRSRRCDNPTPFFGGKQCNGTKREWQLCNRMRCNVVHTFGDQRYDVCYQKYGKGWSWFKDEDNQKKVESLNLNCSFENGLNGWINSDDTKVKWKLGKGPTQTPKTGPDFDHTLRNENGTYLYLESSYPTGKGDTAMLISPKILVPRLCMDFYSHMYGERVGRLRILRLVKGQKPVELWSVGGSQGNGWIRNKVDILYEKEYQIGIEVERATTYLSDIAVDDVTITPGSCKKDATCRLTCYNNQKQEYKINKPVLDGFKCTEDRTDICVDARCERVGCNNVIGSRLQYDVCGVCGGDNSSCSLQQVTLKITPEQLTQNVILIPKGFYKFTATKVTSSKSRLAVRDFLRRATYYYDYEASSTYRWNYFPVRNTTFRYEALINDTEKVYIDGIVNTDIQLQLISPGPLLNKSEVITIEYSVYTPWNTTEDTYTWMVKTWTRCTAPCNGGKRTSVHKCTNLQNNFTVDASKCSSANVIVIKRIKPCNTHVCKLNYAYVTGEWERCPVCDRVGVRKRTVTCSRMKEGEKPVVVDTKHCSPLYKPSETTKCFRYCPRKKLRCVERSNRCEGLVRKGYCKYDSVKDLCCESCKLVAI